MSREGYLEKAQRTGKLIIPSKLGEIPEEAYTIPLTELSLAGNMLKTLDTRLAQVSSSARHASRLAAASARTHVAACVTQLTDLTALNISLNGLDDIPGELETMSKIVSLNMNDNRMKTVPDVVCSFLQLKVLDMSNNSVVSLPDGILGLTQLEELNLGGNKLKDLPKVRRHTPLVSTRRTASFRHRALCAGGWGDDFGAGEPDHNEPEPEQVQAVDVGDLEAR